MLLRIVHWSCAAVALYFVYRTIAYLVVAHGQPDWNKFSSLAGIAVGLWLGGRGLQLHPGPRIADGAFPAALKYGSEQRSHAL